MFRNFWDGGVDEDFSAEALNYAGYLHDISASGLRSETFEINMYQKPEIDGIGHQFF